MATNTGDSLNGSITLHVYAWPKILALEPTDLVEIDGQTLRVIAVEENDDGTLLITASDFFGGYSELTFRG